MNAEPHTTPIQWVTDSAGALQDAVQGLDWQTAGWGVGLLVALGFVARFAPLLGPYGAMASTLIQGAARKFMPKEQQEAQQKIERADKALWAIVEVIEKMPVDDPRIKELKKYISYATPPEFNGDFDAWKKAKEGGA